MAFLRFSSEGIASLCGVTVIACTIGIVAAIFAGQEPIEGVIWSLLFLFAVYAISMIGF
jgi:hypothetical protein